MSDTLAYPWDAYLQLQNTEDKITKICHRERAGDDKMNAFLDAFADGTLPNEPEAIEKKMVNLEVNRQKKYQHRETLIAQWAEANLSDHYFPDEMVDSLEILKQVDAVMLSVDHREWRILVALANGKDFSTVALNEQIKEGALKMEVSRLRGRLRKHLAGAY